MTFLQIRQNMTIYKSYMTKYDCSSNFFEISFMSIIDRHENNQHMLYNNFNYKMDVIKPLNNIKFEEIYKLQSTN